MQNLKAREVLLHTLCYLAAGLQCRRLKCLQRYVWDQPARKSKANLVPSSILWSANTTDLTRRESGGQTDKGKHRGLYIHEKLTKTIG
jgi:hypothetical protein